MGGVFIKFVGDSAAVGLETTAGWVWRHGNGVDVDHTWQARHRLEKTAHPTKAAHYADLDGDLAVEVERRLRLWFKEQKVKTGRLSRVAYTG